MRPSFPEPNSRNLRLTYSKFFGGFRCAAIRAPYFNNVIRSQLSIRTRFPSYLSTVQGSIKVVLGGSCPSNMHRINASIPTFAAAMSCMVMTCRRLSVYLFTGDSMHKSGSSFLVPSSISSCVSRKRPNQALVSLERNNIAPEESLGFSVKGSALSGVTVCYPSLVVRRAPIPTKLLLAAPLDNARSGILFRHEASSSLSLATGYHHVC